MINCVQLYRDCLRLSVSDLLSTGINELIVNILIHFASLRRVQQLKPKRLDHKSEKF